MSQPVLDTENTSAETQRGGFGQFLRGSIDFIYECAYVSFKALARSVVRVYAGIALLYATVGFFPRLASTPADKWIRQNNLSKDFDGVSKGKNTHIYGTKNPLVPIHLSAMRLRTRTLAATQTAGVKAGILAFLTDFALAPYNIVENAKMSVSADAMAAFATSDNPLDTRNRNNFVFFSPPDSFDKFCKDYTGRTGTFFSTVDKKKLQYAFNCAVMAHELAHTWQDLEYPTPIIESLADIKAFRQLDKTQVDAAVREEFKAFWIHIRALKGLMYDPGHATALPLSVRETNIDSIYHMLLETRQLASDILRIDHTNMQAFGTHDKDGKVKLDADAYFLDSENRHYYICKAIIADGYMNDKPLRTKAALQYIRAFEYFAARHTGFSIRHDFDITKISLACVKPSLFQAAPAPDAPKAP